jgi:hypothetical protein
MKFVSVDIDEYMEKHPKTTGEKANFYYYGLKRKGGMYLALMRFSKFIPLK